jgi:hypothetical protein
MPGTKFAARISGIVAGALAAAILASGAAMAQETAAGQPASAAETACFSGPAKMSEAQVDAFLATPSSLFSEFPGGGLPLSTRIRSLAGSDARALAPLVGLVASANPQQISAIGAGLARVARACQVVNPEYAATVQENVASLENEALEVAFEAASQDVQTAAVGGTAGQGGAQGGGAVGGGGGSVGGGGAIGGGGSAGGGSVGGGGTSSSGNSSGSFSVGGGGGSYTETELVSPN